MDIDEIKSWATAQLATAAEHIQQQVAEAEAEVEARWPFASQALVSDVNEE